ncbi:ergosterol biosynthetic protein [Histoplasma capsulatum var. duboisii H88]|uniref:Ergosterol biosynthetic protein n=1 Tax=Ajellomyces capsulatus (strain H88) TaxID=544711 RepID=F0U6T2_AJEC8|nr:ergosterol biosynthetic protein [Histoplasma capsulatum var. duboisii H88]KAG5298068.1 ergosterol biosynthetic protein [Histoplasma ohiense (nom. inval.)]QSS52061.1 ergosterol biosynthetic protein [Histoplasma capsulatum var. duboisii H88]
MSLLSYLPQQEGFLPKWLLFLAAVSSINTCQALVSPSYTALLYNNSPTNGLQSRTFGTWTFISSVVRAYAAFHIDEPHMYDLAMWTFGTAFVHFASELLIFGSAKLRGRFVSPMCVASGTLVWMAMQRGFYLG